METAGTEIAFDVQMNSCRNLGCTVSCTDCSAAEMVERYKGPIAYYSIVVEHTDHLVADMRGGVAGMEVQPGEVDTVEERFDILLGTQDVEARFAGDIGHTVEVGILGCHTVAQVPVRHRLGEEAGCSHMGLLMVHTDNFEEVDKGLAEVVGIPELAVQRLDIAGTEVPGELQLGRLGQGEHRLNLGSEQLERHCGRSATGLLEVRRH